MDTKFQKKYESDMTKKEKRKLEREKLAAMRGLEKIEYILTYYKFHIIMTIIVVVLIVSGVKWIDSWQDENYLYVAVMNVPEQGEGFMDDFRKTLGDTQEHHIYTLDTSVFFTKSNSMDMATDDYTAQTKMMSLVGAGIADVFICPEEVYKKYGGEDGVLYVISELMGEEFVEEHADICIEDAIRVEDSNVLAEYGLDTDEPAYLIVFEYTNHPEIVRKFIEFVVE